jgi:hypothetical protein
MTGKSKGKHGFGGGGVGHDKKKKRSNQSNQPETNRLKKKKPVGVGHAGKAAAKPAAPAVPNGTRFKKKSELDRPKLKAKEFFKAGAGVGSEDEMEVDEEAAQAAKQATKKAKKAAKREAAATHDEEDAPKPYNGKVAILQIKRNEARAKKDWETADEIRDELIALGETIQDDYVGGAGAGEKGPTAKQQAIKASRKLDAKNSAAAAVAGTGAVVEGGVHVLELKLGKGKEVEEGKM